MLRALTRNWWMVLLQGLLTIFFGLAAFIWPGLTLAVLVTLLAVYLLVEGGAALLATFRGQGSFWYAVGGVVSILAGLVFLFRPALSAVTLVIVLGVWAVMKGIVEIVAAIRIRKEVEGEIWLMLSGAVAALFGLYLVFRPGGGMLALLGVIGFFAILKGVILTLLSFKLKGLQGRVGELREQVT